jgi:hypothetical protein
VVVVEVVIGRTGAEEANETKENGGHFDLSYSPLLLLSLLLAPPPLFCRIMASAIEGTSDTNSLMTF